MKKSSLISGVGYGALLAAMAQTALADDLSVTNGTVLTTPLSTSAASNGTPGNISTQTGSTVRLDAPGAVVTIDSNNSIDHSGLLENGVTSGGIGVHILGGFAGNYTSEGTAGAIINITGNGTGNYGLLLDGEGSFTGNISFQTGSAIIVYGEESVGVAIDTRLEGNLLTASTIQGTGVGTTGVKITSEITGTYTNGGTISVRGTNVFTLENVDPLAGSGIAIGASIGQGFLNAGPFSDTNSPTQLGRITNSSTAPAVLIAPSVAGANASNITLYEFVGDTAGLNFSFMNRGNITASENDVGVSTTGMRIGETSDTGLSVLLTNGFYNRGSIQSSSESDNTFSTSATAVPTNATGLEIGYGTTINPFTAPAQVVAPAWDTKAASGSTTTTIELGSDASDTDDIYVGFEVQVGGEKRVVTDYAIVRDENFVAVSRTLTLDAPLTTAPAADDGIKISPPSGTAVALGESASTISGVYNGFTITVGGETRIISDYVVIYDPLTNVPTMKVAKIEGLNGIDSPWASSPTSGSPVTISSSALFNAGSIAAAMNGNKGGVVTAVMIQPGATLSSLTNYGAIDATALTNDASIDVLSAIAINDQSGTLNTIVNYGRISANVAPLLGGTEVSVAADLSHTSAPESVSVLGTGQVIGDILFGSAPVDPVTLAAGNKLTIEGREVRTLADGVTEINNATVFGGVRPAGDDGSLAIEVSRLGTGGVLRTSNVRATSLEVGPLGAVEFALAQDSTANPLISTTGNVTFSVNSEIALTPTSFLPSNGTYTLISAGTGSAVTFENFGATAKLNSGSPFPFLLEGSFSADGAPLNVASGNVTAQSLTVTLRRKTAAELGLQGNSAAIYEPLADAALGDNEFGAALLKLENAEQVQATVATTIPDIAGGMRALTVAMTDQATGVIGTRQRLLLTAPPGTRDQFRFWGQEFYNIVAFNGSSSQPGFGGAGQGVALGVEWGATESARFGLGYTFFSSQETERHPRETKTNGDWNMISAYGAWRIDDFFVAPQANIGMGDFKSRRAIIVSDLVGRTATAKWTNYLAAGGATAGYVIEVGNIDIIPTIAFDVMYLNQGAYDEFGGGGMGLSLRSQTQTSIRSFAGVIGQGSYSYNEGAFMPQLLAGWSHEFANDPITIDGSFESSPGSPFHLVGPTLDANKVVGGMSFGYVVSNWSAGFNYDASASSGTLSQSAIFSISSRF